MATGPSPLPSHRPDPFPDAGVAVQGGVVGLLLGRAEAVDVLHVRVLEWRSRRLVAGPELVRLVVVHDAVAVLLAVRLGIGHVDVGLGHLRRPVDRRVLAALGLHAVGDLLLDLELLATLFDGIADPAHQRGERARAFSSPSSSPPSSSPRAAVVAAGAAHRPRRSARRRGSSSSALSSASSSALPGEQVGVDADHDPVAHHQRAWLDRRHLGQAVGGETDRDRPRSRSRPVCRRWPAGARPRPGSISSGPTVSAATGTTSTSPSVASIGTRTRAP